MEFYELFCNLPWRIPLVSITKITTDQGCFIFAVIRQIFCNKALLFLVKSAGKVVVMHTMQAQERVELQSTSL